MAEVKPKKLYKVEVIESERGWGQKVDDTKYFETEQEARDFCTEFNSENTSDTVPDWYMRADYIGLVTG